MVSDCEELVGLLTGDDGVVLECKIFVSPFNLFIYQLKPSTIFQRHFDFPLILIDQVLESLV